MSYESVDKDAHEEESLRTFGKALELGINLIDTAWIYQVICRIYEQLKHL